MNVRIIVDSTADTTPEVKSRLHVVPMTVTFGNQEYIDGVTIDHKTFYEKLIECDTLPKTSQASPAAFEAEYEKAAAAGEAAVVITVSSRLSGTYQSAVIAAEDHENIYVVDSGSVAIGSAILAEYGLRLADEGWSATEIARELSRKKEDICLIAMLDTLEYLKKGGRLSAAVAFAGGLLNIKPVVCVDDGQIHILGKARGSRQGNNLLVTQIEKAGGVDFGMPVLLGYTGLTDILLRKYIDDSKHLWEAGASQLRTTVIGSVIGTHVGPGAIAAAFFKK